MVKVNGVGDRNVAEPSKVNASKFKKRKVVKRKVVKRENTAAAAAAADEVASVGAGTTGGDALASPPAAIADASPVAQAPKPATDAEGSVSAPVPANAEASASAKKNPVDTDIDAAVASSKGKGVSADNSGGIRKIKSRREKAKERAMNGKGKETKYDEGWKGKGYKAVAKKEGRGENKGAGFIFMCNQQTKQECYQNRLFGMPNGKIGMVKNIRPGAKLFLYDFDLKLLYGVYKAASSGGLNLEQEAFHGKFPAQVKFNIDRDCLPLPESSFKHAIKENYSARSKFHPELSSKQVQRLLALFKPANLPQSVPNNRREKRHNGERRQPHHFEQRRRSLPIEEVRKPGFDEQRHPAVIHVPVEDRYRAARLAPLPAENRLGRSLASAQDERHIYYEPVHLVPEPRHIPLAMDSCHVPLDVERQHMHSVPEPRHIPLAIDSRHVPLDVERQHVYSVPEPRHVPSAYYRTLAPTDDLYYHSVADLGPERFSDRIVDERSARDPIITRDRTEHLEELYQTGGARGAHVEELYRPGELAARADHAGISTRADPLEGLYRSEQFDARVVDLPRRSTYITSAYETHPSYAEPSQRSYSARANASGRPVSSLYSFSSGPVYR